MIRDRGIQRRQFRAGCRGSSTPRAFILRCFAARCRHHRQATGEFFAALPARWPLRYHGHAGFLRTLPFRRSSPDVPSMFQPRIFASPGPAGSVKVPPRTVTASVASPSGPSFYFLELARLAPAEQRARRPPRHRCPGDRIHSGTRADILGAQQPGGFHGTAVAGWHKPSSAVHRNHRSTS